MRYIFGFQLWLEVIGNNWSNYPLFCYNFPMKIEVDLQLPTLSPLSFKSDYSDPL